jgi:hypothetical protein
MIVEELAKLSLNGTCDSIKKVWNPYEWRPHWDRGSQVRQGSQISWSKSGNRQEGTDQSHKGTNRQEYKDNEMATRKSRLRCYSATCVLPIKVHANLLRDSYGSSWHMEATRCGQDWGQLYRKVLGVSNMISNRAILNTMTSIRLAGEVINYLSKEAWE